MKPVTGGSLPTYLVQDAAARAWLQHFDHGSLFRGWHPADVEWQLAQAHRTLRRVVGRVGPSSGKGYWPAMVKEEGDYAEASRKRISARAVSAMEAAVCWAWDHLAGHENERRAVQAWAFCKEEGIPYSRFLKEAGRVRQTEQHRRTRGFMLIAAALCRLGVRIPREVLLARLERPISDMRGDDRDPVAEQARDTAPDPVPVVALPIEELWDACQLAQLHGEADRADAVLNLLVDRVRREAGAGLGAKDLAARQAALLREAQERGFIGAGPVTRGQRITRSDLTARIERNKEAL